MSSNTTLITGGAGYIGSHAALRLLADGQRVVVLDNLYRGHAGAVDALRATLPSGQGDRLAFERVDLTDAAGVRGVFERHKVDSVMHFAALTVVGESVTMPVEYWRVNTVGTLNLLDACRHAGVRRLVFSSTAATYGEPAPTDVPILETLTQRPINPYGSSKLASERLIRDYAEAMRVEGKAFAAAFLRYFNVAGGDPQGRIGEHHEPETHLIPIVLQCLAGLRPKHDNTLSIFGTDYPTPDGTCVRDYVHVLDLVDAHVRVLGALQDGEVRAYNLGIGQGFSVKQVVEAAERVTGIKLKTKFAPRRAGDPAVLYANPAKIMGELGWQPRYPKLEDMIEHAWTWIKSRPQGYGKS